MAPKAAGKKRKAEKKLDVPGLRKLKTKISKVLSDAKTALHKATTKSHAILVAATSLTELQIILEEESPQVYFVACPFGSNGRYGHVAWWYSSTATKEAEDWLEKTNIAEGTITGRCSKRSLDSDDWSELVPNGSASVAQVVDLADLSTIKNNFRDKTWTWSFDEGQLARMLSAEHKPDSDDTDDS